MYFGRKVESYYEKVVMEDTSARALQYTCFKCVRKYSSLGLYDYVLMILLNIQFLAICNSFVITI